VLTTVLPLVYGIIFSKRFTGHGAVEMSNWDLISQNFFQKLFSHKFFISEKINQRQILNIDFVSFDFVGCMQSATTRLSKRRQQKVF
jgi:hypothetical protein